MEVFNTSLKTIGTTLSAMRVSSRKLERRAMRKALRKVSRKVVMALVFTVLISGFPFGLFISQTAFAVSDSEWILDDGEAMVATQSELANALHDPQVHTIYLADDIVSGAIQINATQWPAATRESITIDGINPETGEVHTLTLTSAIQRRGAVSAPNTLTFRNINLRQPSGTTGFFQMATPANGANMTVVFENVDVLTNARMFYNNTFQYGTAKIINSDIRSTGKQSTDILIYCFSLELSGEVNINTACAGVMSIGRSASVKGDLTVARGSNVEIVNRSTAANNALLTTAASVNEFVIEESAELRFVGGNFAYGSTGQPPSNWANTVTVDRDAILSLKLNSKSSYPNLRAATINVNEGATLKVDTKNGRNLRPVLQATTLNLNDPFQVVLGLDVAGAAPAMFMNNMTLNATGIKSIRYYTSYGNSFDERGDYIGDTRNDYNFWWFQENGSFRVNTNNISQSTGKVDTDYDPGDNVKFPSLELVEATINAGNFNYNSAVATIDGVVGGGVRVVQIDGGSRMPTVDTVYVGAKTVKGSGVSGAEITITWPTSEDDTVTTVPQTTKTVVDSNGIWEASVPDNTHLSISSDEDESKVMVTQDEYIDEFSRGDSAPVFADILGADMKIVGRNAQNIFYNQGEITDVPEILFYSDGAEIDLKHEDGRYILINRAISDVNDKLAFERLWLMTSDEHKGFIDAETGVVIRQELCEIPANCTVWTLATFTIDGEERTMGDAITYSNLFQRRVISVRLVEGDPGAPESDLTLIRPYAPISGNYGIPLDLSDRVLTSGGVKHQRVDLTLPADFSDYWWTFVTKDGDEAPYPITLNARFPVDYRANSDDDAGLKYTLYLERAMDMWTPVPVKYVDYSGAEIKVEDFLVADRLWVPLDTIENPENELKGEDESLLPPIILQSSSDFLERGGYFVPANYASNPAVGYYVSNDGSIDVSEKGDSAKLIGCANFAKDFKPLIENYLAQPEEVIYIVYGYTKDTGSNDDNTGSNEGGDDKDPDITDPDGSGDGTTGGDGEDGGGTDPDGSGDGTTGGDGENGGGTGSDGSDDGATGGDGENGDGIDPDGSGDGTAGGDSEKGGNTNPDSLGDGTTGGDSDDGSGTVTDNTGDSTSTGGGESDDSANLSNQDDNAKTGNGESNGNTAGGTTMGITGGRTIIRAQEGHIGEQENKPIDTALDVSAKSGSIGFVERSGDTNTDTDHNGCNSEVGVDNELSSLAKSISENDNVPNRPPLLKNASWYVPTVVLLLGISALIVVVVKRADIG